MIEEVLRDLGLGVEGASLGGGKRLRKNKEASKIKRGSSLALLPCDVLHYILSSYVHIKDVIRLDSSWTVHGERENCWLPALRKLFGRSAALLETGKSDLFVSGSLFLEVSRAWMLARTIPLPPSFRPGEHGLSEALDRLSYLSIDSLRSFNLDYTSMSCWLRDKKLPVPPIADIIFSANELRATQNIRCALGSERKIPNQRVNPKRAFRRILIKDNPPIREVIDLGLVPRFVEFLHRSDNPGLQFEAAWALSNIASGTSEHTQSVIDAGAVPILVKLLASPHQDVCEQAAWALGNVAGDSVSSRDAILQHGVLPALVELGSAFSDATPLSLVRIVSWTLSLLCRLKPASPLHLVSPALPLLARLIHSKDEDTVRDACWALCYLTEDATGHTGSERIEAVMHCLQWGLSRLTELLHDVMSKAHFPALKTVGNIVGATATSASQRNTVQLVVDAGLVPTLVELLRWTDEFEDTKEAILILTNCTRGGDSSQVEHMVCSGGIIPPMCKLLRHSVLCYAALEGLEDTLLKMPSAVCAIKECEGDKMLRALATLPIRPELGHASISSRAAAIIETYFSGGCA